MKKIVILATMIGTLLVSGIAFASSIEPSLYDPLPLAGEAEYNGVFPPGILDQAYVDWIVFNPAAYAATVYSGLISGITGSSTLTEYLYVYQIETRGSPAIANVEDLTIYFETIVATGAGNYSADLDTWHNSGNFANLLLEGDDAAATLQAASAVAWSKTNTTWDYDGFLNEEGVVNPNQESEIAWVTSATPPSYVYSLISDTNGTGGRVPAPAPEPSSMLLLGMGLFGLVGGRIKKRFKA